MPSRTSPRDLWVLPQNRTQSGLSTLKGAALALLVTSPMAVSAQNSNQCISLEDSTACPAFRTSSISTNATDLLVEPSPRNDMLLTLTIAPFSNMSLIGNPLISNSLLTSRLLMSKKSMYSLPMTSVLGMLLTNLQISISVWLRRY